LPALSALPALDTRLSQLPDMRMSRGGITAGMAALLGALVQGCLGDGSSMVVARASIVGGEPVSNPAVVRLVGRGSCMGTLVAPVVVLTAKHCVMEFEGGGPFECDENGELFVDPEAPIVYVGAGVFGETIPADAFFVGSSDGGSQGVQVFVSEGETICASDTALLVLDRPVDDGGIAPLRLDAAVEVGEELTALGQGQNEHGDESTELLGRSVTVAAVGPEPAVADLSEPLSVGFFATTEGPCRGDSGSAAFASTGAAVGVVSSVGRPDLDAPTGTFADCVGSRARYEATATQAAFIEETLATLGLAPWREGEADPRVDLAGFEEACDDDADCRSNVCVTHDDGESRCSHGCESSACPDASECREVDARRRCVQLRPDEPEEPAPQPDDEGCGVLGAHPQSCPWGLAGLVALVVGAVVARRVRKWRAPASKKRRC
jgi:hypothetical protein